MSDNILNSVNILIEKIYKSVEENVYELLDKLVDISPDILKNEPLRYIFDDSEKEGMIFIATSLVLFYVVQYIFLKFVSMYNGKNPENIFKFILRLIICVTLTSCSNYICETVLEINSLFTDLIASLGENITGEELSFNALKEVIVDLEKYMGEDCISLDGLIKGFISFGSVTLLINYAVRHVTVTFLILVMPLAIMFSVSPLTKGIFNSWLKLFVINLSMQWIIKLILIIPISVKTTNNDMFKIIVIGTIYVLYRINMFVKDFLGNIYDSSNLINKGGY